MTQSSTDNTACSSTCTEHPTHERDGKDIVVARRCRIAVGSRATVSFTEQRGLRVVGVVSGVIKASRQPPFGTGSVLLRGGEVLCAPAEAVVGILENLSAETAVVIDAVVPVGVGTRPSAAGVSRVGTPGSVDEISGRGAQSGLWPLAVDQRLLRMCPVTTAVLDALTAPDLPTRSERYALRAGQYLTEHLADLLIHGELVHCIGGLSTTCAYGVDTAATGGRAAVDTTPRARRTSVTPAVLTSEQQVMVLEAMRARLAEPVRVGELAALVGYSQYHFLRLFQATFAQTPYQYLTDLRIAAAQRWLTEPNPRSLGWIAHQCGFTRTESFTRTFQRRVGVTPTRYAAGTAE